MQFGKATCVCIISSTGGGGWCGDGSIAKHRGFLFFATIKFGFGFAVGGLLNATCGNATELIIALFALHQKKILVLKYSLLGSILSNLLLVLGTSLLCGGLANLKKEQIYDRVRIHCILTVFNIIYHNICT